MCKSNSSSIEECPLKSNSQCQKRSRSFKGPLRVIRLCVLGIFLPSLLIAVPLYMRYHVYGHQLYPLAMSDMRLIDNKVSTTWCQRQLVKVNTTFNAFLMDKPPMIASQLKPLTMIRHLELEDDTKEYWGFYLLQGSEVTVSTCVRWPGASLIIIRGHKHLHECAYIGDNSSEELDELMEAIREKTYVPPKVEKQNKTENQDRARANEPDMMKRHREDVEFHHPFHKQNSKNYTIKKAADDSDITDPKMLKSILDSLQLKSKKNQKPVIKEDHPHIHRNSTIAKGETKNFKIEAPHPSQINSREAFDDIIKRLESLGNKTDLVLDRINKKFKNYILKDIKNDTETNIEPTFDVKGRHYSKPAVKFDESIDRARRRKREITIQTAIENFTEDDEEHDLGLEEGFNPDGIADHRGTFNETTLNDYSNSEFWSSFSSSEEALLNCAGLILNLPLTPHHKCGPQLTEEQAEETYLANTITYKVPINGYYFFVFNSENEVQTNYIRVQFHLKKSVYNVSDAVSTCLNTSETCAMNLKFFSSEKLVMELPVRENTTLWNEEFVVVSECEPRTVIYVICVIAVPVLVILFAFS